MTARLVRPQRDAGRSSPFPLVTRRHRHETLKRRLGGVGCSGGRKSAESVAAAAAAAAGCRDRWWQRAAGVVKR